MKVPPTHVEADSRYWCGVFNIEYTDEPQITAYYSQV